MKTRLSNLFRKKFNLLPNNIEEISAHGSNRKYFRILADKISCIGVYNEDYKENEAFVSYAEQMKQKGINVPEIYATDLTNNVYLQEDLGDETLYSFLQKNDIETALPIYEQVLNHLVEIQTMKDFDYSKAYPRKAFDVQSINWDLNYFKYYFLKLADIPFNEQFLENDFKNLTDYLISAPNDYFLFRDFQSRNIMLHNNKVYFIDFQGGRKGALQYDVASLLFDGKVKLSPQQRENLLNYYIDNLSTKINIDKTAFVQQFYAFCYIRIMQAMGAYGFRGYFQRKESFLKSIPNALQNIEYLQQNTTLPIQLPELNKVFQQMIHSEKLLSIGTSKQKLTVTIKSFSYKKGYPMDISGNGGGFVFDCRALPNPGRLEEFKKLTGKDIEVIKFLEEKEEVRYFFENVKNIVWQSVDKYLERGFTHLMLCFGCTGGQHRSVFFAEKIAKELSQNTDLNIVVKHIEQNI